MGGKQDLQTAHSEIFVKNYSNLESLLYFNYLLIWGVGEVHLPCFLCLIVFVYLFAPLLPSFELNFFVMTFCFISHFLLYIFCRFFSLCSLWRLQPALCNDTVTSSKVRKALETYFPSQGRPLLRRMFCPYFKIIKFFLGIYQNSYLFPLVPEMEGYFPHFFTIQSGLGD